MDEITVLTGKAKITAETFFTVLDRLITMGYTKENATGVALDVLALHLNYLVGGVNQQIEEIPEEETP